MSKSVSYLIFSFFFLCIYNLIAQEENPNNWTPTDIINTEYVRSPVFSPDNQLVVWSKRKGLKKEDKFVNNLYLTRLDVLKDSSFLTIPLTTGKDNDYAASFSKDGKTIYFLSSRDKGKKLWSLSVYGGEATEVFEFKNGISNIQWLDEETFIFISNDGKTLREQELEKKKDNVVIVEDEEHWKISRLYKFDIKEKSITSLTDNTYPINYYKLSKDGKWLIYSTLQSRHFNADANPDAKYYLHNMETGQRNQILELLQTPYNFQYTGDGKGFYFVAVRSSDPEWNGAGVSLIYYYDLANQTYKQVDLDWDKGMEGSYQVVKNDIIVALANGATNRLAFYKQSGSSWQKSAIDLAEKQDHVTILKIADDYKKVVYEYSTAGRLPTYHLANITIEAGKLSFTKEEALTKVNAKLTKKSITKHEVFRWKGWNDEEVNGLLYYPTDYEEGKRYPLIISIHGGPSGVDQDTWRERWSTYPQIFAQKGAFVLKPNYHGSSHHGQAFVESIKGHYYDLEIEDITKGIEVLSNKGLVDKNNMGIMGWSNGAIIATMFTVRFPNMFKVCAAGAGDVNWTSDFGTCRFGVSFDQSYFGGAPWDDLNGKVYNETYILKSPLFELDKVKTPTIIFHGSEDRAVPRDQGWEYYRALQQIDQAPVRFLWFPGQPHGLRKITHQLRKMEEELAWIDQYLFEDYEPKNEAFKENSPLAQLLKKDKLAHENGLYGVTENGSLIPEVGIIEKDSLALGLLEVTNAQWKSFNAQYQYLSGQGNYPAQVEFSKINAYLEWIAEKTGKKYRLPNEAEAKALHKKAKKAASKENTLNYWAGYEITRDEQAQFSKKLKEANSSLIKEAASFKALKFGKSTVYDLGGNVAEYDAKGNSYGFSAYDFVDKQADTGKSKGKKHGFRVVLDLK